MDLVVEYEQRYVHLERYQNVFSSSTQSNNQLSNNGLYTSLTDVKTISEDKSKCDIDLSIVKIQEKLSNNGTEIGFSFTVQSNQHSSTENNEIYGLVLDMNFKILPDRNIINLTDSTIYASQTFNSNNAGTGSFISQEEYDNLTAIELDFEISPDNIVKYAEDSYVQVEMYFENDTNSGIGHTVD